MLERDEKELANELLAVNEKLATRYAPNSKIRGCGEGRMCCQKASRMVNSRDCKLGLPRDLARRRIMRMFWIEVKPRGRKEAERDSGAEERSRDDQIMYDSARAPACR